MFGRLASVTSVLLSATDLFFSMAVLSISSATMFLERVSLSTFDLIYLFFSVTSISFLIRPSSLVIVRLSIKSELLRGGW